MPLIDKKILESERNAVYVKSTEGNRLVGTVESNKNVFDKYPELIRTKYNELIDLLIASGLDSVASDLSNRYTKDETNSLVETETKALVADVNINLNTGAITITKKDGSSTVIDTALEKVPATFAFEADTSNDKYYIKVTNVDGTTSRTEVTNLMNQYTFQSGSTVAFAVTNSGTTAYVTAEIVGKSVTMAMLADEVTAYINESISTVAADRAIVEGARVEILNASQTVTTNTQTVLASAGNAAASESAAKTSETNAAESARQAALSAQEAKNYRDEAANIAGGDFVTNGAMIEYVDSVMKVDDSTEV